MPKPTQSRTITYVKEFERICGKSVAAFSRLNKSDPTVNDFVNEYTRSDTVQSLHSERRECRVTERAPLSWNSLYPDITVRFEFSIYGWG